MICAPLRLLIAGLVLVGYLKACGLQLDVGRSWRQYAVIGLINSAIPFTLYAYAARHLPAAHSVVLNSTTPLFGAACAAVFFGEALTPRRLAGLALGLSGVALVANLAGAKTLDDPQALVAIFACLGAALCYALAGAYVRARGNRLPPASVAAVSQLFAGSFVLPLATMSGPIAQVSWKTVVALLLLAVLCSAVAYLLYYRLIADVGPTRALTVTFLMPVFGILWGAAILRESVPFPVVAGCALVLFGTRWVVQTAPPRLSGSRAPS